MSPEDVLNEADKLLSSSVCEELDCMEAFHPEKMTENEKAAHEVFSLLYRLIHSHNKRNCCYDVHRAWRESSEKLAGAK